jgi:hypothetical protein
LLARQESLSRAGETLTSNLFPISRLPDQLLYARRPLELPEAWPAVRDDSGIWLFELPTSVNASGVVAYRTNDVDLSPRGRHRSPFVQLLRKYLRYRCTALGLRESSRGLLYFPRGLLEGDRLGFTQPSGRRSSLQVVGFKTFRTNAGSSKCAHHLGVDYVPRLDRYGGPAVELRLHVHVLDDHGQELPPKLSNKRRKRIAKSWFNHQWWSRQEAVAEWFSDRSSEVDLSLATAGLAISARPLVVQVPVGIQENHLDAIEDEPEVLDDDDQDGSWA